MLPTNSNDSVDSERRRPRPCSQVEAVAQCVALEREIAGRDRRRCPGERHIGLPAHGQGGGRDRIRVDRERLVGGWRGGRSAASENGDRTHSPLEVSNCELLLRLPEARKEPLQPSEFLHVAERFGLIQAIDVWVLRKRST